MPILTSPLSAALGLEVSGVDLARASGDQLDAIHRAWEQSGLIIFRGQRLTNEELLAFSRRFGELDPPPVQENGRMSPAGYPDIYVVSNVRDEKGEPIGALGAGEAVWHTDMSYLETPPDASILYALEIPPHGGNTWFCGMQAACAALPADLRAAIAGRRIKHDGTYNSGGYLRQGVTPDDDPQRAPGAWHPAICRHPATGAAVLFLGRRRNSFIEGLDRAASEALLDRLWAHATGPDFTYEHRWQVGDLVMWDNRATMHRRDPFDPAARRVMHRTQIRGTRHPVAFPAA
ncbi:MAG: TauD/TfdA family dioxygenase [Alphaproteobacteria bacterium]|nr:TauD/TfdA family dioxygenase [Alphaproteobacteria bacterium]